MRDIAQADYDRKIRAAVHGGDIFAETDDVRLAHALKWYVHREHRNARRSLSALSQAGVNLQAGSKLEGHTKDTAKAMELLENLMGIIRWGATTNPRSWVAAILKPYLDGFKNPDDENEEEEGTIIAPGGDIVLYSHVEEEEEHLDEIDLEMRAKGWRSSVNKHLIEVKMKMAPKHTRKQPSSHFPVI